MSWPRFIVVGFYAILPLAFIVANHLPSPLGARAARWPELHFQATSVLRRLDQKRLRQSVDRLPAVALLRQTGNSLRLALGQDVSWCMWSSAPPVMLFHRIELWVSEGLNPANRAIVDRAMDTMLRHHDALVAEGWRLVAVPVPTKLSTYRERLAWPVLHKDYLSRDPVAADRADEIYDQVVHRLRAGGVATVDLRAEFRRAAAAKPDHLLYPPGETHWSGRGLAVAARATAAAVAEVAGLGLRDAEPTFLEVEETADLAAAFNPLPSWTSRLTPVYRYRDRLINGESGRGYVYSAEPAALAIFVGTSYSGQFTWHIGQPVGFAWTVAGQINDLEFHNRSHAGEGSFAPFSRFLTERQSFEEQFLSRHGRAPTSRILVWEFPIRDLATLHD